MLVQDGEHPRQEMMRYRPFIRVDVDDGDLVLDGDRGGTLGLLPFCGVGRLPGPLDLLVCCQKGVGLDDGAFSAGVFHVLDADGDGWLSLDHLVHC